MKKMGFWVLATLLALRLQCQEYITISGKVIDVETEKPLPFSTISIQNKPIGVVANDAGDFEFTFPRKHLTDTIVFSMAGYQSEKVLAQSLIKKHELKIELVSKAVV
ncbi:MAG: carboxypeptidase-like regulatory domain-containing protein, partial [Bacteroidota bacterium]